MIIETLSIIAIFLLGVGVGLQLPNLLKVIAKKKDLDKRVVEIAVCYDRHGQLIEWKFNGRPMGRPVNSYGVQSYCRDWYQVNCLSNCDSSLYDLSIFDKIRQSVDVGFTGDITTKHAIFSITQYDKHQLRL